MEKTKFRIKLRQIPGTPVPDLESTGVNLRDRPYFMRLHVLEGSNTIIPVHVSHLRGNLVLSSTTTVVLMYWNLKIG